jgi:hypothetical protein
LSSKQKERASKIALLPDPIGPDKTFILGLKSKETLLIFIKLESSTFFIIILFYLKHLIYQISSKMSSPKPFYEKELKSG